MTLEEAVEKLERVDVEHTEKVAAYYRAKDEMVEAKKASRKASEVVARLQKIESRPCLEKK